MDIVKLIVSLMEAQTQMPVHYLHGDYVFCVYIITLKRWVNQKKIKYIFRVYVCHTNQGDKILCDQQIYSAWQALWKEKIYWNIVWDKKDNHRIKKLKTFRQGCYGRSLC